jgi:hypothetical protein
MIGPFLTKTHPPPPPKHPQEEEKKEKKYPHIAHGPLLCIENQEQAFFFIFFSLFFSLCSFVSFFLLDYIIP